MQVTSYPWWERTSFKKSPLRESIPWFYLGLVKSAGNGSAVYRSTLSNTPLAEFARCFQRNTNASGGTDFVAMMNILQRTRAADPRDKVYGLLSLSKPALRDLIEPDYSKSVSLVFQEATYASIVSSGNFDIMVFVDKGKSIHLPTWAYYFTMSKSHWNENPSTRFESINENLSGVLSRRLSDRGLGVQHDPSSGGLRVTGRMFDSIAAASWYPLDMQPSSRNRELVKPASQDNLTGLLRDLTNINPYEALARPAKNHNHNQHTTVLQSLLQDAASSPRAMLNLFQQRRDQFCTQHHLDPPAPNLQPWDLQAWKSYLGASKIITAAGFLDVGRTVHCLFISCSFQTGAPHRCFFAGMRSGKGHRMSFVGLHL